MVQNSVRALLSAALLIIPALSLMACSAGADSGPAGAANTDIPPSEVGPTSNPNACTTEGAVAACASTEGSESGGMILCAPGTRTCGGGVWSACTAAAGVVHDWFPATSPCDPCAHEGEARTCKIPLPNQGATHACATGHETCTNGYWGKCL